MKRFLRLIFLLPILFSAIAGNAVTIGERLNYKVVYRWGLVNKQAGRATFSLRQGSGGNVTATMYARTEPWADHLYTVRDTLISHFNPSTCLPSSYQRIAHEGDRYANDKVTFFNNGTPTTSAKCVRLRKKKDSKTTDRSESSLSAKGDAVDLLSSFYYLRNLNFSKMVKGTTKQLNIFSGKKKEILKIKYNGLEEIKIDGVKHKTHYVTFTFTSDQGKTTSKPIKAWLSIASDPIPLKLVGELSIGRVECIYTGK